MPECFQKGISSHQKKYPFKLCKRCCDTKYKHFAFVNLTMYVLFIVSVALCSLLCMSILLKCYKWVMGT